MSIRLRLLCRPALLCGALALVAICVPTALAARTRRPAHAPAGAHRRVARPRRSRPAGAPVPRFAQSAPAPATLATGASRTPAPAPTSPVAAPNAPPRSKAGAEPFSEPPEEAAAEAADQPAELEEPAPTPEAEEAAEAEEPVNETGEGLPEPVEEIPGSGPRKYAGELPADTGESVLDPVDARFLGYVPFGTVSFWIQPWRAYLDTWPASRLLDAVGVNFSGNGSNADAIATLLADSGFKLARRGVPWDALSYSDPTSFRDPQHVADALSVLHRHGLRPLLVLDADSQAPGPARRVTLETTAPAPAGAQTVKLTPASAAQVILGKTGFDGVTFGGSPDDLITAVAPDGTATLSRPLLEPLAAGPHGATILRYAPFADPVLPDGQPNPVFRETLQGWLAYVGAVCKLAAGVVGPGGFDLEVWNELTFGSQFLNVEHYEWPVDRVRRKAVSKAIRKRLLAETVAFVRNPANGISPAVGITDGFASQTPFPSGANAPLGMTALSKHPYVGARMFPAAYLQRRNSPIDALGNRDAARHSFTPYFVPAYQSLLPEYTITGIWTESLIRDVAPFTTYVYGYPHGRYVGPPGGAPVQKWITEFNMSPGRATPVGPDGVTPQPTVLSAADKAHFQAKALLRDLVAMVSKGFTRDYFFQASAKPGGLNVVGQGFLSALESQPGAYPGDAAGGETTSGFRNMLARFHGPGPGGTPRQLKLLSIVQEGNHAQFAGDGSAAHPPLYDRDVLAVFPFQSSPTHFVIPVYVMTRDLLTLYHPGAPASDVTRFDLPDESFRIELGGLPISARAPTISAYDPLGDRSTPARLISREGETATIEIAATDYPRLLSIEYPNG